MAYHLVRRLESEWTALADSTVAQQALSRWAETEPALAGWRDFEHLRTSCRADAGTADRVLAALVRWAATDGRDDLLAARVVVQLMLPGAVRLIRTMAGVLGGMEAAEATVISELAVLARTYPWRRRPTKIAANLLLDCRQRLVRPARRAPGLDRECPDGLAPGLGKFPATTDDGTLMALDLLRWARRRGVLSKQEAALLFASHVAGIPMKRLQQPFGRSRSSLFSDRATAEHKLRAALAAEDVL